MTLKNAWIARLKLYAEGDKLRAEGNKIWAEGNKIWAEEAKLWAEGNKLWADAIISAHGNITLEWKWCGGVLDCHLGTGEIFRGDEAISE